MSYKYYEQLSFKITYDFVIQLITTFQAAVAIVLAFQANEVITKAIHRENISSEYAIVIPALILASMLFSLLKNKYSSLTSCELEPKIPHFIELVNKY